MTALRDLQRMVRDAVFESGASGPALTAVSKHIEATADFSAADHLLIYRRAVLATLVRTLGAIHPVCHQLVGEEFFAAMAQVFARQTPSASPDLGDYGENFSNFIAGFEPAAGLPYLTDVARLEWHWHRAFHAPDESGIDVAALGAVNEADTGHIVFRLPISASLLTSNYPIQRIWQVNQDDWAAERTVDLDAGGANLIIWRRGHEMRIDEPNAAEWSLLGAINAGQSLREIGNAGTLQDLDATLPCCVQSGWIAGFELRE